MWDDDDWLTTAEVDERYEDAHQQYFEEWD